MMEGGGADNGGRRGRRVGGWWANRGAMEVEVEVDDGGTVEGGGAEDRGKGGRLGGGGCKTWPVGLTVYVQLLVGPI